MVSQDSQRFLSLCVQCAIVAIVAFAYFPGIFIHSYTADDYIFLAQVKEYGLAESLLIPFADHFIPIYRLLMGGFHLLFESAVPIRCVSLGFHLLNTCLVFRIVRGHTGSGLLAAVASLTLGFSPWDASDILRCVNGHWAMSLFFVLLMAVYFEKFHDSVEGTTPSSAAAPDLKYYFAGLVSFAIGLGIFTNALFGGTVIWLFAYARLLLNKKPRRPLGYHLKIVAPFFLTIAAYLLLRYHFGKKYFAIQNTLFHLIKASDSLTFQEKMAALAGLPLDFFLNIVKQLSPYFPQYGIVFLLFLALLLGKQFAFRKRETHAPVMWLAFALATFLTLGIRDIFLYVTLPGPIDPALPSRYLYYPLAGISIALGLLLRPSPSLEETIAKTSARTRTTLAVVAAMLLLSLNVGKIADIRAQSFRFATENRRFHGVVAEYRESMAAFLRSPAYSPDRQYHFRLTPAVDAREYPSGYAVMQSDIFKMYFPKVPNIHFTYPDEEKASVYVWKPEAVAQPS